MKMNSVYSVKIDYRNFRTEAMPKFLVCFGKKERVYREYVISLNVYQKPVLLKDINLPDYKLFPSLITEGHFEDLSDLVEKNHKRETQVINSNISERKESDAIADVHLNKYLRDCGEKVIAALQMVYSGNLTFAQSQGKLPNVRLLSEIESLMALGFFKFLNIKTIGN